MRKVSWLILIAALVAVVGCRRMPLYDLPEKVIRLVLELDLEIDLDIRTDLNVDQEIEKTIKMPELMRANFYGLDDDHLKHTEYVGPTGGVINPPSGQFNMLVYTFGTEFVQIRGENDVNTFEAFTSDITASKASDLRGFTREGGEEPEGPIIYAPDHLLVARELVEIPEQVFDEENIVVKATARTVVETYSFEVPNVVGAEYIKSCEAFVTNQSRSILFGHEGADGRGEPSKEPATLSFPVGVDYKRGCLYTTFNTFGKLPGVSRSYLYILIRDTDGQEFHVVEDITDQFDNPDHQIVIKEKIVIPIPPSYKGGVEPSVVPWEEEIHNVNIG